ncbi:calcineurin subunit B [Raphidocelis subcapitata]|uniref:Calcineurin subunit B n=1 Tax=Raphidocelis subcapitata TaxID=307507 RepID=A0A2V0NRB1_9CHLO|nr:calcineurin subunit B [Raphidocelis subcapitata]|eukprot:GBF88100.1 calcineurin subunit B [Raphidocelis subcapitata]
MGQAISGGLTQNDVDEVVGACKGAFSQEEVESLYRRFRSLDRGLKGYIGSEELLAIPELSINPLAQRVLRLFESVNFLEFVKLLAPFTARVSREDKLQFLFTVFDVDGDGLVSPDDMHVMLRQLAGSTLTDDDIGALIARGLDGAGSPRGLTLQGFKAALAGRDLGAMEVVVPSDLS